MKKLFIALFFLVSISTIFKPEHIFSTTEDENISSSRLNICLDDFFDFYAWTGDEKSLDLEFPLPQGMQLPETYLSTKSKDALSCEIQFNLIDGHHIVSSESLPLEEVVMKVKVKNIDDLVSYKIAIISSSSGIDEDGDRVSYTEQTTYRGQITCPPVDVTQGLELYHYTDEDIGVISFRHVFEPVL